MFLPNHQVQSINVYAQGAATHATQLGLTSLAALLDLPAFITSHETVLNLHMISLHIDNRHLSSLLSLFWENKISLWDHHLVCVAVYPSYHLLKVWKNLCDTWYNHHGTLANQNGKLQAVSVHVSSITATQMQHSRVQPHASLVHL
jgi:hypothetical protein